MMMPGEPTRYSRTFDRQLARIRRSSLLAGCVVLVAVLLLIVQIVLVSRSLTAQRQVQEDNIGWIAASLNRDMLRLEIEFRASLEPDADPRLAALRRAFDVFYSRMGVVSAQVNRKVDAMSDPQRVMSRLMALQTFANETAAALDSGRFQDRHTRMLALDALKNNEALAFDLANDVLIQATRDAADRQSVSETRITWLIALAVTLSVQLVAIAAIYRRLYVHALRQDAAVESSTLLLRKAIDAAQEAVVVTDGEGRIVLLNGAAAMMGGLPVTEALGRRIDAFLHLRAADQPSLPERLVEWARRGRFQGRIIGVTGQRLPVSGSVIVDTAPEGTPVFIFFLRDMTEPLKRRAEARRARQTVVREAWRRTRFLASVTHEMRTPLQIADTALSLIEVDELTDTDKENLEMARDAVTLAVARVEETIAAALPERAETRTAAQGFSPQSLLRALLRAVQASPAGRDWRLSLLAEALPLASGRPQVFALAVSQIIEAAILSGGAKGALQIVLSLPASGHILVRIRTDASAPDAIHQPRTADLVARAAAGIAAMGARLEGDLWQPGGLRILLNTRHVAATPSPRAALDILVVDDSRAAARVVARDLQKLGHTVMESHSGAEAVALAMLRRFDAIVLDLRMPDMDGLEVAAYVRSGGESQAARLILLSANALPEDEGHLRAAGVDRILTKPARRADLIEALESECPAAARPRQTALPKDDDAVQVRGMLGADLHARMVAELLDELAAIDAAEAAGLPAAEIAAHVHRAAGSSAILGLKALNTASCSYEMALNRADGNLAQLRAGWHLAADQARARLRGVRG